jgi:integrase
LRKGDLLGLRWNQIDLDRRILCFAEQKKRGKRDVKVLNSDFLQLLREIPRNGCEYIFTGADGEPLQDMKRAWKTALKKAGVEDFHFHDLRHTSASYLVMRGASMKAVQAHLGHTSLAMTERYAHLSPDFLRSEVERLSGVFVREEDEVSKKLVRSALLDRLAFTPNLPVSA